MRFEIGYAKLNDFYYDCLQIIFEDANKNDRYKEFLERCYSEGVDLYKVPYKRVYDNYEIVELLDCNYKLLPLCLVNENVRGFFVREKVNRASGRFSLNSFNDLFFKKPYFSLFHYRNDCSHTLQAELKEQLKKICKSYIQHYKDSLEESWTEEEFYVMFNDLQYVSLKYAMNMETNEIDVVGFFGAAVRRGAGGKTLTNAELYLLPEFRKRGIAKKLVGVTFEMAKADGIENFDSITYRIQGNDSLAFWQSVGAKVSGLIHIEGSISEMIDKIDRIGNKNIK